MAEGRIYVLSFANHTINDLPTIYLYCLYFAISFGYDKLTIVL